MIGWLIALIFASGWQEMDAGARSAMKRGVTARLNRNGKKRSHAPRLIKKSIRVVVDCLIGLAGLYDKRGDVAESERLYELAMRTVEGIKGGDSAAYADRLPSTGGVVSQAWKELAFRLALPASDQNSRESKRQKFARGRLPPSRCTADS